MNARLAELLPHGYPAILLTGWREDARDDGLTAVTCLRETQSLWLEEAGLPAAYALELLGQAAAVFLRLRATGEALTGGRMVACDSFQARVAHFPPDVTLTLPVRYLGGSSQGFHKFTGTVEHEGRILADATFSVLAFTQP